MHSTRADCRRSINGIRSALSAIGSSEAVVGAAVFVERTAQECKDYVYRSGISALAAKQHIERTGAAMSRLCRGDGQDAAASANLGQPPRHRALQHAGPLRTEPSPRNY